MVIAAALLCYSYNGNAQVHKNGIGLQSSFRGGRFNNSFSYQLGLNDNNRIQLGLGYRQNGFDLFEYKRLSTSIYYQHVWNIKSGLNWYLGAGAKYDFSVLKENDAKLYHHNFTVGPTIGLEYDFNHKNIPLVLTLDYRPSFVYSPSFYKTMHFEHQIGLSLHYTFGDKKKLKKD